MSIFENPQFFMNLYPKPIVGILMAHARHISVLIDGKPIIVEMVITHVQTEQDPKYLRLTTRGIDTDGYHLLFKYYHYFGFWREDDMTEFHFKKLNGEQTRKLTLHNGTTEEQAEYILTMAKLCGERIA